MTTQVVNLLHLRSLASGEIPVNMEFGQFAVNVYNVENPTLPTLRDVSFFIGTGGNERVDEDGTDRSADVTLASGFAGEAVQPNKGWVRYQMRKVRATGDSVSGDLIISGAKLRFDVGGTGNAQLVLPNETVAVTGELGSLRYNTVLAAPQFHNGTNWITIKTPYDHQSGPATPLPTVRSDGTALVDGDRWFNTTYTAAYTRVAGAWVKDADVVDAQVVNVAPTARGNTDFLQIGDFYFNPDTDTLFIWTTIGWQKVVGSPGDYQTAAVAPTVRSTSDPLVAGDYWYDTTNKILKIWDGVSAWFDVIQSADFQVSATAPTTRSLGGALVDGDFYYNTTFSETYIYQGGAWTAVNKSPDFQTSATKPTTRSNTGALVDGDIWVDSTINRTYYYDTGASDFKPLNTHTFNANATPAAASTFVGDTWFDFSTGFFYVYSDNGTTTQWVQV